MVLPTDVALKTSSYAGSAAAQLEALNSDWVFSWPGPGQASFMDEVCLLAGEEFDALVFNALHGYYRQAIGCLRNALETMTIRRPSPRPTIRSFSTSGGRAKRSALGRRGRGYATVPQGRRSITRSPPNPCSATWPLRGSRTDTRACARMHIAGRDTTTPTSGRATDPCTDRRRSRSSRVSCAKHSRFRTSSCGWVGRPTHHSKGRRTCC
jgi:hypothetical protein